MKQLNEPDSICVGFDEWAEEYEELLNSYISLSGEATDYFYVSKITCLKRLIPELKPATTILDFGCGIGKLASLTAQAFPQSTVYGYDISPKCLEIARKKRWGHFENLIFSSDFPSEGHFDLIIAANVFHHIKPPDRIGIILQLRGITKTGRNIVIFEHNPHNPFARYIVRTCPFDKEAELISPSQFISLAHQGGLRVRLKRYIIFFPSFLGLFRRFEPYLGFLPLGVQYMLFLERDEPNE